MATFPAKDPNANLDYQIDWTGWLGEDTITTSVFVDVTDGITMHDITQVGGVVKFWLSGGEDKKTYRFTNRVTTAGGRIDDRTFSVKVSER